MEFDEEEEIKARKLQELRERQLQKQKEEQKNSQAEMQLEMLLKQLLSPEAKTRLSNVRMVNQELYGKTVQAVIYLANAGQFKGKIGEGELKALLAKLNPKKEITIKRK
jgi:programmed cell death protein 5